MKKTIIASVLFVGVATIMIWSLWTGTGSLKPVTATPEHFRRDAETHCRPQSRNNGKSTGLLQSSAESEHFASDSFARAIQE